MAARDKGGEGVRMLDEFTCQAILNPAAFPQGIPTTYGKHEIAGARVEAEVVLKKGSHSQDARPAPQGAVPPGKPRISLVVEIALDREFTALTPEEQEQLLATVKGLLKTHMDVQQVKQAPGCN